MSCPSRGGPYLLRLAGSEDGEGIRRVLEDGAFPGKIAVRFTRRPDPYASYRADGEDLIMPVAADRESGEIAGVGGCVLRRAYVNGELMQTGYLTGMKIRWDKRCTRIPIREAYELIRQTAGDRCGLYLTTILDGNEEALRLLEKCRPGMPSYHFLGRYTVYCTGTGRRSPVPKGLRFVRGHDEALAGFYRRYLPEYQLAPPDEWLYGLTTGDFYSLREESGTVLAAGALWNQQGYKQYTVAGYGAAYQILRRLPTGLLGYPVLPKTDRYADYVSIALPVVDPARSDLAEPFLRLLAHAAGKRDFVMLGLPEEHPLAMAAGRLRHIKYGSRLYAVTFAGDCAPELDGRPAMLEVGLL